MTTLNINTDAMAIANALFSRAKQRTTRDEFHPRDLLTEEERVELRPVMVAICYSFYMVTLYARGVVQKTRPGHYVVVGGSQPIISGTKTRKVMEF